MSTRSPILEYADFNPVSAFTPPDETPLGSLIITESGVTLLTEASEELQIEG